LAEFERNLGAALWITVVNLTPLLLLPFAGTSLIRFYGSRNTGLSQWHSDKMKAKYRALFIINSSFYSGEINQGARWELL